MKLAFDAELENLREEFRKPLASATLRNSLDWMRTGAAMDSSLWTRIAGLGWLGSAVPAEAGGSGLNAPVLCLQAEEVGRALAPIPFVSSVCGYGTGVLLAADSVAQSELLSVIADGTAVGVLLTDDCWRTYPVATRLSPGKACLQGATGNVPDGAAANVAIACVGEGEEACIVQFELPCATRQLTSDSIDPLHPCARFQLNGIEARVLLSGARAAAAWREIIDRYALYTAFEQIGAAAAALEMARQHALQRYAFGRPIASFQALKHAFADLFAALDLARSNCLFGAAALSSAPASLHEAASVARIAATEALRRCARGNMQVHGALGVTWESGCHLYYRRAQLLAGHPGAVDDWKDGLIGHLMRRPVTALHAI